MRGDWSVAADCVTDGGVCDGGSITVTVSSSDDCDPYLELGFSCDTGGECQESPADGGLEVAATCGTGGDGSGGGSTTPLTPEEIGCPACDPVTSAMKKAMKEALNSGVVNTTIPDCSRAHMQAIHSIDVGGMSWGHKNTTDAPGGHDAGWHSDREYFHFYIDTDHGGFPWVGNGWSTSVKNKQLAGIIMHELIHHYKGWGGSEESKVDELTAQCVPGYDEDLGRSGGP